MISTIWQNSGSLFGFLLLFLCPTFLGSRSFAMKFRVRKAMVHSVTVRRVNLLLLFCAGDCTATGSFIQEQLYGIRHSYQYKSKVCDNCSSFAHLLYMYKYIYILATLHVIALPSVSILFLHFLANLITPLALATNCLGLPHGKKRCEGGFFIWRLKLLIETWLLNPYSLVTQDQRPV